MVQTSLPELNAVLPFPEVGLSLITGPASSGKTTLLMDVARTVLADAAKTVVVVTAIPDIWEEQLGPFLGHLYLQKDPYLLQRNPYGAQVEALPLDLVLVDGDPSLSGALSSAIQDYAYRGPIIFATRRTTSAAIINASSAAFELSIVDKDHRKLTITKNREGPHGAEVVFGIGADLCLTTSSSHEPPDRPSRWEVLMGEDTL